jgi:putative glutamine amidotransferase
MMRRPVIGLTLDIERPETSPEGEARRRLPIYALRENYCAAVARAGGVPVLLPHETELAEAYLAGLDRHPSVTTKDRRTAFELAATRAALARDLPVLGICGGQQLLNVVLGGTLVQHIPDEVEGALAHEQPNPRDQPGHPVEILPGSLLHRICGAEVMQVNSAHHQAAKDVGPGARANAWAPDGVIEGIEAPDRRFCLGVQWHPEYGVASGDRAIFAAFVAAAAEGGTP